MPSTEVFRKLTISANAQGFNEARAALDGITAAHSRLGESARVMAITTDSASKKTLSAVGGLERLARASDEAYAAEQKLVRQQNLLTNAMSQGLSETREFSIAQAAFARSVRELGTANDNGAKASKEAGIAHKAHGAGMGAAAGTGAELVHILKAIGDETAAGVPLTRSLAVEGGRLFQVMSSGQLGGALSFVGSKLAFLANPLVLAGTATLGLGAAALYAASSYRSMNEELDKALRGVGGFSGLNAGGLNDLATRVAPGAGLSIGASREAAETFTAGGHLDAGNTERAIGLVRGYAGAFGTSYSEAGKGLNDVFADPVKGAEKLNERLGFLNARTLDYITTLRNEGDVQGAIRATMDAASVGLNTQAEKVGFLAKVMRDASVDAEHFRDALGKFVFGPSDPIERMREAEHRIANPDMTALLEQARRSADEFKRDPEGARGRAGMVNAGMTIGTYDPATDPWTMSEDIRRASQLRDMQKRDLIANQQSLSARDITRSNSPEMLERQKMQEDRDNLAKSLGNPDAVRALGPLASAAFDALSKLNIGLATYATAAEKTRQTTAYSTALIGADDVAERTLIETQKAYVTTLQATKDATQAAADAEKVRAEAVANAQKRLDESEHSSQNQMALIGLNPTQRILEEAKQAREALKRDNEIPAGAATLAAGVRPGAAVPLGGGFEAAVNRTLGFEGARLQADTNGTPTQFGINAANNPGVNLDSLTIDHAKDIYRKKYWDPLHLDGASAGLQRVAFDTSVMSGPGRANQFIKQSDGDADVFMNLRQQYEAGLLAKNPAKYGRFATSWQNRDAALRLDLGKSGTMEGDAPSMAGADPKAAVAAGDALAGKRVEDLYASPFRSADQQLEAMQRSNAALAGSFGMSADKVAGINERIKIENELIAAGARSLDPYQSKLDGIEQRWQTAAKATDDARKANEQLIGAMDDVRGSAKGFLDPLVQAGLHGTSVMAALHSGLESVASKLTGRIEDTAIDSLFGKSGTPSGGLSSGLFSGIGKLFGFASGGYTGAGGRLEPAGVVHKGEYVFSQPSVSRIGVDVLHAMHTQSRLPGYADGGLVGGIPGGSGSDMPSGDTHIHVQVNNPVGNDGIHQMTHAAVTSALSSYDKALPGRLAERQRRTG